MIDRGTFTVSRIDYHDPDFDGAEFSPRDAWHFLVGAACYAPIKTRIAGVVVDLDRGQCGFSIRFLAEKWGWSKSRVDRFLDRIEASGKIRRERVGPGKSPGITVLTVCHYSAMQGGGSSEGRRETGTVAGQQRDSVGGTGAENGFGSDIRDLRGSGSAQRDSLKGSGETLDRDSSGTKKDSETQDIKKDSSLCSESPPSQGDAKCVSDENDEGNRRKRKDKIRKHIWPKDYFDQFWRNWPKKVDISDARKVLENIYQNDVVSFEEIISGVNKLAETIKTNDDKQYCKGPARWLRAGAWTNEFVGRTTSTAFSTNRQSGLTLAGQNKSWWLQTDKAAHKTLQERENSQRNGPNDFTGLTIDADHRDDGSEPGRPAAPARIIGW